MKIKVCEKCVHFQQHYIYSQKFGFSQISCGHCHKKLTKVKDCGFFEENLKERKKEIDIMQFIHQYDIKMQELSFKLGSLISSINNLKNEINTFLNK